MIETKFEIPTIATETLLLRPDGIADFPGVVFMTDIWGIRPANIGMARRGFRRTGSHQARYWNTVIYERPD